MNQGHGTKLTATKAWALHLAAPIFLPFSVLSSIWLVRRWPSGIDRRWFATGLVCDVLLCALAVIVYTRLDIDTLRYSDVGLEQQATLGAESSDAVGAAEGVVINLVHPGSAAARAGIDPGDTILEVDGVAVRSVQALRMQLATAPGEERLLTMVYENGIKDVLTVSPTLTLVDSVRTLYFRVLCQRVCLVAALLLLIVLAVRARKAGVRGAVTVPLATFAVPLVATVPAWIMYGELVPPQDSLPMMFNGELLMLGAAMAFWWAVDRRGSASLQPQQTHLRTYWAGMAASFAWLIRGWLLLAMLSHTFIIFLGPSWELGSLFDKPGSAMDAWQLGLTLVVLAPIAEELLFRGALLDWLGRFLSVWPAIFCSAAIFAALHATTHGGYVLQVAVLGVVFGWMRCKTGSPISSTLLHASINGLAYLQGMRG